MSAKKTIPSDIRNLFDEAQSLISHPRADEIFANDWLHDGELPVPSAEFMQYLGFRLMTGCGIQITAATSSRDVILAEIVKALRDESDEERLDAVRSVLEKLKCYRLLHAGKKGTNDRFAHEWRGVLWPFLYPADASDGSDAVTLAAGRRAIAREIIESMVLRAVFRWDSGRIEGLAAVLREIRDGRQPVATIENRAAGEIMRWLPWLSENLGHHPSKSEMKAFILDVSPDLSDKTNSWAKAWKLVGYPKDNERERRIDLGEILQLARSAKSEVLSD